MGFSSSFSRIGRPFVTHVRSRESKSTTGRLLTESYLWGLFALSAAASVCATFVPAPISQRSRSCGPDQAFSLRQPPPDRRKLIGRLSSISNQFYRNFNRMMKPDFVRNEAIAVHVGGNDNVTHSLTSKDYYVLLKPPPRTEMQSHAIFGPLFGRDLIERYVCYRRVDVDGKQITDGEVAVLDIKLGNNLNGHDGIVHGGIISLLFDDAFGWGVEAMHNADSAKDLPVVMTANLEVNFRAPVPGGSSAILRVYHDDTERRKVFLRATLENHDGSILYAEASSLYIKSKEEKTYPNRNATAVQSKL